MGSNSGLRDGDFDRLSVAVDLAVGSERNFGTNGQVLTSAGEGEQLFWGTNSATLPQGLVAGSNITFNPAGTFNGSVETTISATDTNTEYTEGNGIQISGSNIIQTRTDNDTIIDTYGTGGGANNKLHVEKVPNTLTITDSDGTSVVFDGSSTQSITINDNNTEYTGTAPIVVNNTTDDISLSIDSATLEVNGSNNLAVKKVPHTLTITDSDGTSVVFDGDADKSITINDNDTTYQADLGVEIDTTTSPDTIKAKVDSSSQPTLRNDLNSDELAVLRVPNNLSVNLGLEFQTGTSFDGSALRTIVAKVDDTTPASQTITNSAGTGFDELKVLRVPQKLTIVEPDGTSFTYDGSVKKTLTLTDDGITTLNAGSGITITDVSATEKTITADIDNDTLGFTSTIPKEIEVVKLPHTLTITDSAGTSVVFDGDTDKSITINDNNTEYTGTAPIVVNNTTDDISLSIDSATLEVNGSNNLAVKKVPNQLVAGSGITMTGNYDGSAEITISSADATTTETIVVQVNPTTDTSYAVYRKQLTDARSLTEQFYPIDTNFHYEFTDNPVARYYKVDIQLHLTNGAIALPVLSTEPVFLRLDKDSNGDDAWGIPQVIDYAFRNGTTIHIKQASFIVDFGSNYATLTAPELPDIHPSMIQQSATAVSPSAGRRATNENALVLYGGVIAPQGLMMVLTPMGDDITTTTTGNPYSITGSDGINYDSKNVYQNPYISIATRVQEETKLFSAGTSYVEYSSNFRVSFVATSSNILVEFRAIVRADNRLFYGGLYDYNASSWITNTRTRFNYNDESDQDFTIITWIMKGLTKGNTYYISPYFRSNTSLVYIYAGHNNSIDGYAPAIMRIMDGGNDVSYVEPADDY
jgi:hypothetical protein